MCQSQFLGKKVERPVALPAVLARRCDVFEGLAQGLQVPLARSEHILRARLEARNRAHDDGAWVRDALNAYDARQHGQAAD